MRKDQTIETWIMNILTTKNHGEYAIQYRSPKTPWYNLEDTHKWDFYGNEYRIVKARRYTIRIDPEGIPEIVRTGEDLLDLPLFGKQPDGSIYIQMEEVQY